MKTRFLLLLACIPALASAQIVISADGILSITPGASFYAAGDFINNGQVLNNGSLNIAGAWTNDGVYEAENGQVDFNGEQDQVINHNAQSFAKLVISGGGEKIFKADITIQGELVLEDGVLSTDNSSRIILASGAAVTGGSSASYVQGPVHAIGSGQKIFPVGANGIYLPVTLADVTGNNPQVGVELIEPNDYTSVSDELQSVSTVRSWSISNISGFTGSPVTLTLANETFTSEDNIVVAVTQKDGQPFNSLGRSAFSGTAASGSVTSANALVTNSTVYIAAAQLTGEVNKTISVFNVVTPGNDGKHDFLKIVNIEYYANNEVAIVNRWGDKVFEVSHYNNTDNYFSGEANVGGAKSLTDGTYYYVINPGNGDKKISGFLTLKR